MNTLTIIVMIIIGACAIQGLSEGFIRTTFRLVLNIAVLALSIFLTPILLKIVFRNLLQNGTEALNQLFLLIIVFALLRFGVRVIVTSLDIIAKLPILKTLNRLLGFVAGLAQGVVFVWIMFMIASIFSTTTFGIWVETMSSANPYVAALYKNNLVMDAALRYFLKV